ncbi:MAG TPA: class I SAM-dependent methyltransferase [Planctomycetes bacterium]|nr:class I SAM-dependent methyltransferase [Planctomycetota bacterium]
MNMAFRSIWQKFLGRVRRIRRTGLLATLKRQFSRWSWGQFEQRWELDTGGSLNVDQLGTNDNGFGYQPIDYLSLEQAFAHLPNDMRGESFVDFGCGKGRALLFAAMRPFAAVWGVELNKGLATTATENLTKLADRQRCQFHHVAQADARDFPIPDTATILFFYNPFAGDILRKTLENIYDSLVRAPRKVTIIYALPQCDHDLMAEMPWLAKNTEVRTCNSDWERLTIYESVPIGHHESSIDHGEDPVAYTSECNHSMEEALHAH